MDVPTPPGANETLPRHTPAGQLFLPLDSAQATVRLPETRERRAIERDEFPFEEFSEIAELESWRKEINRPLSHIHKWWAQRLGTVFRAIILGALSDGRENPIQLFYKPARCPDAVIFDPFMGSGTTLVEALKLGASAIGRDINPIAYSLVKNALGAHQRAGAIAEFRRIERDVADTLKEYYEARLPTGQRATALYYFWVKTVSCPSCKTAVDLFSSRIFARHAYPKKYPKAQSICPRCDEVSETRFDASRVACNGCGEAFDPRTGPARGQKAQCPCCSHAFSIARTVRGSGAPPAQRMYAKLVLTADGEKRYLRIDEFDRALFEKAASRLATQTDPFPLVGIEPGYNTNQVLAYNYRHWHEFFNARQLLGMSVLGRRIAAIADEGMRELFMCLLSGTLEFNNMFASHKGEGTGAVRHMFSHHILKPERVPLEANLWGTPRSSGSFSTMFENRILRAIDYASNPFELGIKEAGGKKSGRKIFGLSEAIGHASADSFADFARSKRLYLSCGDSSRTDLADKSVDLVVTDPPFFDNVHYSQLADFFHVWQRHFLGAAGHRERDTTRSDGEVQHGESETFTRRLASVLVQCHRVLKDEGLLIFTYHHSRADGWRAILDALLSAEFAVVAAHPMKAEMSVAMPKHQAKEPIDLDVILVCRKRQACPEGGAEGREATRSVAEAQTARFRAKGRSLSRNDVRVIVMGQLLRKLSRCGSKAEAMELLDRGAADTEALIDDLTHAQQRGEASPCR